MILIVLSSRMEQPQTTHSIIYSNQLTLRQHTQILLDTPAKMFTITNFYIA